MTTTGPTTDIESFTRAPRRSLADPNGHLSQLRATTPVARHPSSGYWFLLRYDDVDSGLAAITRQHDTSPRGTGSAGTLRGQPVRRALAVEPTAQYLTRTTYQEFAFGDTIITLIIARFPKTELTGHELNGRAT